MDAETKAILVRQGSAITTLTIQTTILTFAVEALLSTNKDRATARVIFDQLWGQFQAGPVWSTVSAEESKLARAIVEKIFS